MAHSWLSRFPTVVLALGASVVAGSGAAELPSADPPRSVSTGSRTDATPGLVAAYGFEEGSGSSISDASGTGNAGAIRDARWTPAGKYGNALEFDGVTAWVVIEDAPSLDLTTGMTLEGWVSPDAIPPVGCTTTNCRWMDVLHKNSDRYYIEASSNVGGRPEVGGIFAGGKHILFGPSALPTHAWTHLALTSDGATLRFYVNGTLVASEPETTPLTVSDSGLYLGGDPTMGQFFDGRIDEVRVYDVALTQTQIQADMRASVAAPSNNAPVAVASADPLSGSAPMAVSFSSAGSFDPDGLPVTFSWSFGDGSTSTEADPTYVYGTRGVFAARVSVSDGVTTTTSDDLLVTVAGVGASAVAAYGFNEGSGPSVADLSGNGDTGAIQGAVWTTAGKFGQALSFNGSGARVTVNDAPALDLVTGMTLEAWVYPTSYAGSWKDVIFKAPDKYYLEGDSSSGSGSPATGGTFASSPLYGPSALPLNAWSHLAATYDGATIRLFQDGVEVASRSESYPIEASNGALSFGADAQYDQSWVGRIDEVRIYNYAISAEQIQSDMVTPVALNQVPVAIAAATPASGMAPLDVAFTCAGSYDPEGAALAYEWIFGDGSTSTQANPRHTFASPGVYTARLTVSDGVLATASSDVPISASGCQDADGDGRCASGAPLDCDDTDGRIWATPGEVRAVSFSDPGTLTWSPPADSGGVGVAYDVLRSDDRADFVSATVCIESGDGSDETADVTAVPGPGAVFHFLVRAANTCPSGRGTLGSATAGQERAGRSCP